ncbi:MAG: (2Fe-2S)-binding protein [Myxococcales bacterium]|nr:(2Fe-2S)-binding protein [Myxococcales bacterium]
MPSPLGLRRRLGALFGFGAANATAVPDIPKVGITLVGPDGTEQITEAFAGSTLVGAGAKLKRPIATGCSESNCGTCRVEVLDGAENLSEQTAKERATLKENNFPTHFRLACRAELIQGSVKVRAFELI